MSELIERFWQSYLATLPKNSTHHEARYRAESWGDNPQLADELAGLIVSGRKTATCSALWEYQSEGSPIPVVGALTVLLSGSGKPLAIVETTEATIRAYQDVDAEFAKEEGEGDLSLEYWREGHWRFFSRALARIGKTPALDIPFVCEKFRVVYKQPVR
jgi:uncharacterized protein YhfF